jgi:hypothetical protein
VKAWLQRLLGVAPACKAARDYLWDQHPDWEVWTSIRSHRATEDDRTIVAVFYQIPSSRSRPARYRLFAVSHDLRSVEELPLTPDSPYRIRNYK